jgi:hypothetical protein
MAIAAFSEIPAAWLRWCLAGQEGRRSDEESERGYSLICKAVFNGVAVFTKYEEKVLWD